MERVFELTFCSDFFFNLTSDRAICSSKAGVGKRDIFSDRLAENVHQSESKITRCLNSLRVKSIKMFPLMFYYK